MKCGDNEQYSKSKVQSRANTHFHKNSRQNQVPLRSHPQSALCRHWENWKIRR